MAKRKPRQADLKPIPGYPGYRVSKDGVVVGLYGRPKKPQFAPSGYLCINAQVSGKAKKLSIHDAVLLAFVGPPPPGFVCKHCDGDRTNNHLTNLKWAPYSEQESRPDGPFQRERYRMGRPPSSRDTLYTVGGLRRSDFRVGEHWAWRKGEHLGSPARRVSLVEHINRRKGLRVKIRYEEGERVGSEAWVWAHELRHKWKDWERMLRREVRLAEFKHRVSRRTDSINDFVLEAAELILRAIVPSAEIWEGGVTHVEAAEARAWCERAGFEQDYWRHYGEYLWISFKDAYVSNVFFIKIARELALKEPETVSAALAKEEARLRELAGGPAQSEYAVGKVLPLAIVQRWLPVPGETALQRKVERLEGLLSRAVGRLRRVQDDEQADVLESESRLAIPW